MHRLQNGSSEPHGSAHAKGLPPPASVLVSILILVSPILFQTRIKTTMKSNCLATGAARYRSRKLPACRLPPKGADKQGCLSPRCASGSATGLG